MPCSPHKNTPLPLPLDTAASLDFFILEDLTDVFLGPCLSERKEKKEKKKKKNPHFSSTDPDKW